MKLERCLHWVFVWSWRSAASERASRCSNSLFKKPGVGGTLFGLCFDDAPRAVEQDAALSLMSWCVLERMGREGGLDAALILVDGRWELRLVVISQCRRRPVASCR